MKNTEFKLKVDVNSYIKKLENAFKKGSLRDAINLVAAETGLPRRTVYQGALKLTKGRK